MEWQNINWKTILTHIGAFGLGYVCRDIPTPAERLNNEQLTFIRKLIEEWRPVNCEKERDYQLSLHQYLLGRFKEDEVEVTPEYGAEKSIVDIVVDREYAIELKHDLHRHTKQDRLHGQIDSMKSNFDFGIVVVTGDISENDFRKIKNKVIEKDQASQDKVYDVVVVRDYP